MELSVEISNHQHLLYLLSESQIIFLVRHISNLGPKPPCIMSKMAVSEHTACQKTSEQTYDVASGTITGTFILYMSEPTPDLKGTTIRKVGLYLVLI